MVRRYVFAALPHHEFRVGAAVYHGGDVFELEESLAVDQRLIEVLPDPPEPNDDDYADVVEDEAAKELEQAELDRSQTTVIDSSEEGPDWRNPGEAHSGGVAGHHADLLANPVKTEAGHLEHDDVDDRDDAESGMPRPKP